MKEKSYSQIGQDLFVKRILQEKRNGLFFDIGGGFPIEINNTYLLEREYNWTGISIDLESKYSSQWKQSGRSSTFLIQDAITANYSQLFKSLTSSLNTNRIDYLSIDLEPPINTLLALKQIPFNEYKFTVITFEHDLYRKDPGHDLGEQYILWESRDIFVKNGYGLVFSNKQEDWWVDKDLFKEYDYLDVNELPKDIIYG
jgi:hypothetical protein